MTGPTTPRAAKPASRTPLWLRLVLLCSLALNLLVAGTVAGHLLREEPRGRVPRVDRIEGPMTFALSREDRREIGQALRKEYRNNRPSRGEIEAEYKGVIAALRADPFQPERVEQAFARQRDAAVSRMEIGQKLLMERLTSMTPAQRLDFADRLEEGLKRGPGDRGDTSRDKPRDGQREGRWPRGDD